jgi:hypothetical protein
MLQSPKAGSFSASTAFSLVTLYKYDIRAAVPVGVDIQVLITTSWV